MNRGNRIQPNNSSADGFLKLVGILEEKYGRPKTATPIVLVLGAAASFWSGKPSWIDMKAPILEEIEKLYLSRDHFIEEAWRKLSAIIGLKNPRWSIDESRNQLLRAATTDMICSVADHSEFVGEKVRLLLKEYFGFEINSQSAGPPPQLGYELLAHFLKHKYVDHIITFNFDEVIDTCLDNELGPREYNRIITDHQLIPKSEIGKPCLIKLHGSISSPQSLRFTHERTRMLSQDMLHLIDEVLFYNKSQENGKKPPKKICLVSLGYSWNDIDFANWVKSRIDYIDQIIILTLDDTMPELIAGLGNRPSVNLISARRLSSSARNPISIDQFLWALWNELEKKFSEEKVPYIPVSRHLILGHIFGPRQPESQKPVIERFLNDHSRKLRLLVEMYLHLIKCKGMVNASVMAADPRISRYYEMCDSGNGQIGNPADTFTHLRLSQFADIKETYFSTAKNEQELFDQFVNENFAIYPVSEPIYDSSQGKIKLKRYRSRVTFIENHIQKIYEAPEVEVAPGRDRGIDWLFVEPRPLTTFFELQSATIQLLQKNWTKLIVIAETGEWLSKDEMLLVLESEKISQREIFLLRTSMDATDDWHLKPEILQGIRNRLDDLKSLQIHQGELSWWEHNRHLTLALGPFNTKPQFLGGIYFRRRLKASRISPVAVKKHADCLELFFIFLSYVRRSCEEKPQDPERKAFAKRVLELGQKFLQSTGGNARVRLKRLLNGLEECLPSP